MISLKNINKCYVGDTYNIQALESISFDINEGEFVSIMGKSGSGKTTLLNILGFLDVPDSGDFYFMGNDVSKLSARKLWKYRKDYIGFVFQNFALINHCSVYENVILPLEAVGMKRREYRKKALEMLEMLGILELKDKFPGQISGGQKQRVAIARALVGESKVILADEPTGALDAKTSIEIMNVLKEINGMGKTIILVTHDEDIAKMTKRIITIEDAKIVADRELLSKE